MAATNPGTGPSTADLRLTGAQLIVKYNDPVTGRFRANDYEEIDDADLRELVADVGQSMTTWRELTIKKVKGAPYPLDYTDQLGTIPVGYRVLGMQAVARFGVDSASGGSGVIAPAVTFQLIRASNGLIDALRNEEAAPADTVKATWVITSGTSEQLLAQFELLELEDHPYKAGDVVKYVFPGGETRLIEWRADSVDYQHPVPTGRDDDPIYAPFAPLASNSGSAAPATLRAQCFTPAGLSTVGPFLFDAPLGPLTLKVFDNVASMSGQVNYRDPARDHIWNAGTVRYSTDATPTALAALLTTLSTDIALMPAAGMALGGELLLKVKPLDTGLSSSFLLDGAAAGVVVGRSAVYRQPYTGPPPGNQMTNSQFADATGWSQTGSGMDWVIGSGQAGTVNGNAGNSTFYRALELPAGDYTLIVGILSMTLGSVNLDIQCPIGAPPVYNQFITNEGDTSIDFTIPAGIPAGRTLFQFTGARELVFNHIYLLER